MEKSSIVGHARQIAQLERDIDVGNVAHAYLFVGQEHVGKTTVARWFGTELLTRGLESDAKAVAQAHIGKLIHPDFLSLDQLWIEEVSEDLDEIARSSNLSQAHRWKAPAMRSDVISIDDIRGIQERMYETGSGSHRVCFIRGIDRLQDAAANAFLKMLEEPPEGRVFILTSSSDASLLPTIVSRARVLHFDRVPDAVMTPLVQHMSREDQAFVIHVSQGAPGAVITLAHDPDALREERLMHGQARSVWGPMSLSERLRVLSPLGEKGKNSERFLVHLALTLRESPVMTAARAAAFRRLVSRLQTNAYKPLIAQEFALGID